MKKLAISIQLFAALAITWLILIIGLGIYEYYSHASAITTHDALAYRLLTDTIFWLKAYLFVMIPFLLVYYCSPKAASWIFIPIILILILGQAALQKYFSAALVPLGADIYGYSWKDITQTAGASGTLHITDIIIAIIFIAAAAIALRWALKKPLIPIWIAATITAAALLTTLANPQPHKKFASEFDANASLNKLDFFLTQSKIHFFPPDQELDIYSDEYAGIGEAKDTLSTAFTYPDETQYPFFHIDSTRDVLSPFFKKPVAPSNISSFSGAAPNIVIILVEGLGRAFTNNDAWLGNFTPFLDSLAGKSLYWKNFLSQGGRTFAVLPSISGSLPFAKNGFLELGNAMPDHYSLPGILKDAGYHTSFYYGGDAHFDNMDLILKKEGIDELNDGKTFPASYTRLPAQNGFSWGVNDAELFRRWLDTRPTSTPAGSPVPSNQPQCSIILTVSTHSPFVLNDPATYIAKLEKRFDELGFDENAKASHRQFKEQYMSILYADDALRNFFTAFSKRADFNNTVFFITGDHRMPEIPMRNKIDRYHVPLMIYSPLLTRTAEFASISTHYDITPSILAWLHAAYGIKKPGAAQWMGSGIDTARAFRNIHAYPMMQTKTDLVDFIKGEYHLNNGELFKISMDMNEEPANNPAAMQAQLSGLFNTFLRKNEKLGVGARLLPDSVRSSTRK